MRLLRLVQLRESWHTVYMLCWREEKHNNRVNKSPDELNEHRNRSFIQAPKKKTYKTFSIYTIFSFSQTERRSRLFSGVKTRVSNDL